MITSGAYAKPLENSGQLYKTDIPDEAVARFLDWDKPLSQQKDLLQRTGPHGEYYTLRDHLDRLGLDEKATGKDLMQEMGYGRGVDRAKGISEYLKEWGVPGIKYLDRDSRSGSFGSASGTSNFVVFDPELIRILERNGQATGQKPWPKKQKFADPTKDSTWEPPVYRDTTE
jgi:hypothetical protein